MAYDIKGFSLKDIMERLGGKEGGMVYEPSAII
jgi:hypothetical protein